jgi:hypothetical protein
MAKVLAEVTGSISFSQRGDKGQKGALMREHDGFESGSYKYLSGAGEETYVDVVCVKGKWYQCTKTYDNATSSPSLTDGHWTVMSNYKSIATHLLLAENATINMLGSNQINLFNPSGGAMFGSFRVVSNDNDYALWLGAPNGADAPFSVKRSGFTKMTEADITGKITAKSGSIGDFSIVDGSIKLQYTDAVNNQSLYFGYGDSGVKAELSGKDDDNNDMACKLVVAQDELKRKNIGLVTSMSGFKSKFAPNELYIGDFFKRAVMVQIYRGGSGVLHRYSLPVAGVGCYIDSENSEMSLVLRGLRSGSTGSVWSRGEIYEENGFLKIYKGF